jgi:hypothetical protein
VKVGIEQSCSLQRWKESVGVADSGQLASHEEEQKRKDERENENASKPCQNHASLRKRT